MMESTPSLDEVIAGLGPRLRLIRMQKNTTLASLSETTGISISTLSRLESGDRKPSLELLWPIARAHQMALDDLVTAPPVADPRVRTTATVRENVTILPLTLRPGGLQAYKLLVRPEDSEPRPRVHEGYEWLYVLDGTLRLILGEHDLTMKPGEAAEFDTRVPHWFGAVGQRPVEVLSLFGPQGERMHVRAKPTI
ncbi:Helix-turn-helix domain protein [Rhodococcus sp. AW25M09]|uniref:helix-turn-helix domain-containing protein n=1 Tax=Rhodococcus sp. AW25M09 TaxID=1268303 RepID=UPI0002ABA752|nr:XRE family transcriptional regulator [Rhodococcus sp. AW25M09]CCQ17779.1 Helix-turn-helix domain protein [Rhodococcus sp. AW25M09]